MGGVVFLALVGALIFFLILRRRRTRTAPSALYRASPGLGVPPPMSQHTLDTYSHRGFSRDVTGTSPPKIYVRIAIVPLCYTTDLWYTLFRIPPILPLSRHKQYQFYAVVMLRHSNLLALGLRITLTRARYRIYTAVIIRHWNPNHLGLQITPMRAIFILVTMGLPRCEGEVRVDPNNISQTILLSLGCHFV